ncbi:DUF6350 family protein [Streptomyces sp. NPDC092952]|uniref:cell division protein PerM n=1 Tax=Streptomyces sp. NPDC092952 TaxID=3366018 RepID=UPI00380F7047
MSQVTESGPMLSADQGRSAALPLALLRGAVAAGLGLGAITVLVLALWISSPDSGESPASALHTAAALWLLAHGAELVRAGTPSGVPAPVGVVPLLLAVVPVWLVHRAARDVLVPDEERPALSAPVGLAAVVGGYLLVGAAVAYYARGGALAVRPLAALFPAVAVVAGAAAAGVWTAAGHPVALPAGAPAALHRALAGGRLRERAGTVWRAAAAGVAMLVGGGALLVAVGLVWHAHPARQAFVQLSGDWPGRVAVLLLAVVLVPNAAVWGAAYGLGPGFALGTASTVTPLAFSGRPALPRFPLLAAVPAEGAGTLPNWAALGVPVAAGVTVAWFTVRRAAPPYCEREEAWGPGATALVAAVAGIGCGIGTAVLAAAAGGPLGTRALAEFGPVWWLTGAAAAAWVVVLGVPGALLLRFWRLRGPVRSGWWWLTGAVPARERELARAREKERARERAEAYASAAATSGNAGTPSAPVADPDLAPYDFLPADPWYGRTARPEEAGPSGSAGGAGLSP